MNLNKLTQKAQDALSEAQNIATSYAHQQIDGEHLLLGLIKQENGLIPRLLEKMDVPVDALIKQLDEWLIYFFS